LITAQKIHRGHAIDRTDEKFTSSIFRTDDIVRPQQQQAKQN
jgi:hypothetical protein